MATAERSLTDLHREALRLGQVAVAAMTDRSMSRDEARAYIRAWGAAQEARAARIDLIAATMTREEA